MKTLSFSIATLVAATGTAMAKVDPEGFARLNGNPVAGGGERTGPVLPFDVTGIDSWNSLGSPANTVVFINVGAGVAVNGLSWDVTVTAFAPSWRSELSCLVSDSTGIGGIFFSPGTDASPGGPSFYSSGGVLKFANYTGLPPTIPALGDGLIRLEFFETYDDGAMQDGEWNSGTIGIQLVPTPGAVGLLGLAGVGLLGRKRR